MGLITRQQPALPAAPEPAPIAGRLLKKRIILQLDTDQSIQGVLMEMDEDAKLGWSILRAAKLLGEHPETKEPVETSLAGETFVPHHRVVFAQLDE